MTVEADADKNNTGGYPWRRFFARTIDMYIYSLLWRTVAYLILYWNISGQLIVNLIVLFSLMILLEPFMLRAFGTTPGKAIFGIRIRTAYGDNLTLRQGRDRVWSILALGYGYGIPIYSLVRMYKSYKRCKKRKIMAWDKNWDSGEKNQYIVNSGRLPLRVATYILTIVLIVAISFILPLAAHMPKHRGELSREQFLENLERYAVFHGMFPRGSAHCISVTLPDLIITEADGVVTEISFARSAHWTERELERWIHAYIVSFVGAREGVNFWNLHIAREGSLRGNFPCFWSDLEHWPHSHTAHGIKITYEFDTPHMFFFGPIRTVRFSMRRM